MEIRGIRKILGGSFSLGLMGLGVYNLYWFVYYFMHGREISVIPSKMQLLIVDIAVLAVITVTATLFGVISRKLRRKKPDDSSGSENG